MNPANIASCCREKRVDGDIMYRFIKCSRHAHFAFDLSLYVCGKINSVQNPPSPSSHALPLINPYFPCKHRYSPTPNPIHILISNRLSYPYALTASFTASASFSVCGGSFFCEALYMAIRVSWATPTQPRKKLTAARR